MESDGIHLRQEPATAGEQGSGALPPSVLVVDDDEGVRSTLRLLLRKRYRVATVGSGEEALATLEAAPLPDLLLLDVHLPGLDGLGVLSVVRGRWPDLPTIVLSGEMDPALAARVREMGAADALNKEQIPDDLLARMTAVLAARTGTHALPWHRAGEMGSGVDGT